MFERLHAIPSKHFLASLCSQKSLNELMALWFESESHVDIPDTNFSLHFSSLDLNTTEPDIFDEVLYLYNFFIAFPALFCDWVLQPSRVGAVARLDNRAPAVFEYSSLPPGIPHYIFEIVLELIKDNEPHEDILEM